MPIILSKATQRIFDILKGSGQTLYMFDSEGTRIYDSETATRFFTEPSNMMIMVDGDDSGNIKVYISSSADVTENKKTIDMIRQTARHYNMDYSLKKFGKKLSPKDFAHLSESSLFGSSKSSYQKIGEIKLILRHSDRINEEIRGARSRRIAQTFIEDAVGQRFKLPTNWLSGNRAIAKYVSEGGTLYDDTGAKLKKLTEQYVDLRTLFKFSKTLTEQTKFTKDVMVNTWEKINEISKIIHGINSKTLYEETINTVNNITNVLNEDNVSLKIENLYSQLKIDPEDLKMRKIIENVANLSLDEARPKKGVDFEVTPQIQKWAEILEKLDAFSSDDTDRSYGPEGEEIRNEDFLKQAKRLAEREITRFPGAKQAIPQKELSSDPEVAAYQKKADYYATISQYLNPSDDAILGNIISRLSDHYMYLVGGQNTTMPQGNATFKYIENLADAVAKMVGVNKAQYESINNESISGLTEWFKKFDVNTIMNEERAKKLNEKKTELAKKVKEIKETRRTKAKNLVEDQEKFFGLATKVVHFNEDESKIKKLTKYLSESQKRRLVKVIESTWDKTVTRNVAHAMNLHESYDWASVNLDANISRLTRFDSSLGDYARKIADAINKYDIDMESKKSLGNVLSHLSSDAEDPMSHRDPENKMDLALSVVTYDGRNESVKKIVSALKKLAYRLHEKHYGNDDGLGEAMHNKMMEAKDGRKATSAMSSSDKMAKQMDRIGSSRQFALDKARKLVAKGKTPKEALAVVNIPANKEALDYVRAAAQMAEPEDKYAAMAKKYGIKESDQKAVFSGRVKNKAMFVEAITKEKGDQAGRATKFILEGKSFAKIKRNILETISDYALEKNELELGGAILRTLNPAEETVNEAPAKSYVRVVVEGLFKDLTGEVVVKEGEFYTVKLNDVIDTQTFHIDELDILE